MHTKYTVVSCTAVINKVIMQSSSQGLRGMGTQLTAVAAKKDVYVVVQFYLWFQFYFPSNF